VPHERLLLKIGALGIGGEVVNWIRAWLRDRKQRVVVSGVSSDWSAVTSGVPQGSVLGPILFIMFINDIEVGVCSNVLKFADDTKLFGKVGSEENCKQLRADLRRLYNWSIDWQMLFNLEKCKIMHFGYNNPKNTFLLGSQILDSVKEEKDLGVLITDDLKVSNQCVKVVKTANQVLGMIKRTFTFKTTDNLLQLYKSLVRPHLEYCMQVWCPYLRKDIDMIEGVQRKATRMILGYSEKSYEDRLKLCKLLTLEQRRHRGDMIEVFKLLNGFDDVKYNNFFELDSNTCTRGHKHKLIKPRANLNLRLHNFSHRVINAWNNLPAFIVESHSVNSFKHHLSVYLSVNSGL
jgi:ribonuclease P/MRP protein subunit RPP40